MITFSIFKHTRGREFISLDKPYCGLSIVFCKHLERSISGSLSCYLLEYPSDYISNTQVNSNLKKIPITFEHLNIGSEATNFVKNNS